MISLGGSTKRRRLTVTASMVAERIRPPEHTIDDLEAILARRRLIRFTERMFPGYRAADHHRLIASHLEAVERGEIDRLLITMPPRHGKSELASVHFPAWFLGRNPDKRVIATSYAAALANRFSRRARNVLLQPAYPFAVKPASDLANIQAWDVDGRRGGYVSAGVGGPITGMGAHLFLIDDPVKSAEDVQSSVMRQNVWEWYQQTAYTRLEAGASVVVIGTRWHEDDLIGRLLSQQDKGGDAWTVLHLPALDVDGNALWPEKYDRDALDRIKAAIGSRAFGALYQGTPTPAEGALWHADWFENNRVVVAPDLDRIVVAVDPAVTSTATSDETGICVAGRGEDGDDYVLDSRGVRLSPNGWAATAIRLYHEYEADLFVVERNQGGAMVANTIRTLWDDAPVTEVVATRGKALRADPVAARYEQQKVHHVGRHDDLEEQMVNFPAAEHDDLVDAAVYALTELADGGGGVPLLVW